MKTSPKNKNKKRKLLVFYVIVAILFGVFSTNSLKNSKILHLDETIPMEAQISVSPMEYDKVIFIDSVNGNDSTGDGSQSWPYKTLDKISQSGIIQNDYTYVIKLADGQYDLSTSTFTLTCNKSIKIIGNCQNTILNVPALWANGSGGSTNYDVWFYRLVWNINANNTNTCCIKNQLHFYNVAFNANRTNFTVSYFSTHGMEMVNCTLNKRTTSMFRKNDSTILLTNCYGGFSEGYNTSQGDFDYQTNYITTTPSVDGDTYEITDDESVWKDVGTGTDPDGSVADLGVYGGDFSWNLNQTISDYYKFKKLDKIRSRN